MDALQKLEKRYLIIPKILYFVVNMQYYTLHQFRSAFAREKFRVGNKEYGRFSGAIMFLTFFTNIIVGGVSDKTRRPRAVLLFLTLTTALVFYTFYVPAIMNISINIFWLMLLIYLVFNNPKQPLLDKIILDYLGRVAAGPKVYGKQRMWGTVAYGAATIVSEWCLMLNAEPTKDGRVKYDFTNLLYYSTVTTVIAFLSIAFLISSGSTEENTTETPKTNTNTETEQPQQRSILKEYGSLLRNTEYLFFIFIIFSNAVTRSAMSIYLSIFHREVLKLKPYSLPKEWPGWLTTIVGVVNNKPISAVTIFGIAFEVLVMFVSEPILNKLGFFWPLLLAQLCSLVRFFAYYAISPNNPHTYGLTCIFEFIKGIYFGMAHISAVQIATRLAPPHLKATSQMIYQGTFNALGSLIGGYVFGGMFNSVSGAKEEEKVDAFRQLFMINGIISFITILVYFYKYGIRDKVLFNREAEEAKLNAASIESVAAH
ncbi:hypothetical protein PAEPH01_0011 [Pancytospora epiphaga]|nr:hypothetical protein PAEPH01_0011 [Pancytospora epiphaga]